MVYNGVSGSRDVTTLFLYPIQIQCLISYNSSEKYVAQSHPGRRYTPLPPAQTFITIGKLRDGVCALTDLTFKIKYVIILKKPSRRNAIEVLSPLDLNSRGLFFISPDTFTTFALFSLLQLAIACCRRAKLGP